MDPGAAKLNFKIDTDRECKRSCVTSLRVREAGGGAIGAGDVDVVDLPRARDETTQCIQHKLGKRQILCIGALLITLFHGIPRYV